MYLTDIEFEMMHGVISSQEQYWPLGTTTAPNYGAPYGFGYVKPKPEIPLLDTTMHGSDDPQTRPK